MATELRWDNVIRPMRDAVRHMAGSYTVFLDASGHHLGYVTFKLTLGYKHHSIEREAGTFDIRDDLNDQRVRDSVVASLAKTLNEMMSEMMDPYGLLGTISVKEVYAEVAHLTGEEHEEERIGV